MSTSLYPYPAHDGPYALLRDGEVIFLGTEGECWECIHNSTSHSVWWALRYEGYEMRPSGVGP